MIPAYGVQVQKQGNFFPQKVQVGQKAKILNFTTKPIQKICWYVVSIKSWVKDTNDRLTFLLYLFASNYNGKHTNLGTGCCPEENYEAEIISGTYYACLLYFYGNTILVSILTIFLVCVVPNLVCNDEVVWMDKFKFNHMYQGLILSQNFIAVDFYPFWIRYTHCYFWLIQNNTIKIIINFTEIGIGAPIVLVNCVKISLFIINIVCVPTKEYIYVWLYNTWSTILYRLSTTVF